ncbi:hypothetical protein FRX31_012826, partial [Thalictrum thalictroides]
GFELEVEHILFGERAVLQSYGCDVLYIVCEPLLFQDFFVHQSYLISAVGRKIEDVPPAPGDSHRDYYEWIDGPN